MRLEYETENWSDGHKEEYDHVILDMLKGLKAKLEVTKDIFEPELGAYGSHSH